MDYLTVTESKIPVVDSYDVVVLGGGPAGVSAAVSSARTGAKTAIVERYGYLGGQATGGLVILLVGLTDGKNRIIKGFCEETINKLNQISSTKNIGNHVLFDAEAMKYVFDLFIEENGVTPFYHSFVSGMIKKDDKVSAVIIDGKSGKRIIKAKTFVDATGDADLTKFCDIPFEIEGKSSILPITLGFRVGGIDNEKVQRFINEHFDLYRNLLNDLGISTKMGGWLPTLNNNEAWFNISHVEKIDATNADELTIAEITARKQIQQIMRVFREQIDGFEIAYLIDTAAQIGVRETRRINGVHRFLKQDIMTDFEDEICRAPDYTGSGRASVSIPFGCLVSESLDNVVFSGRGISVEHDLIDMIREIPCCMATGQAAGIAAALSAKNGLKINQINIKNLQQILSEQGAHLCVYTGFNSLCS